MDAQENKRLVMEAYRLFLSGDIPQLLERYHDDALWIEPEAEHIPFAGRHNGKAEIARFFEQLNEALLAERFEPKEFIAEGDKVVVTGEATWRGRHTGRSYDSPWVHVFTLRDGKVARFQSYHDTAAGERALRPDQPGQAAATGTPLHH
ncbi:nuclear transport factor 2 family protein [Massilia sp. ST3]|uniref:nuclear transport factor 2 family protein n=1 Tax=Massilia sp. ST3 TaxID=2824903 RepID=UPI001B8418B8|nr:nuclear transport factor 2 family protein [Massilia sp. ST3]MBQ5947322.1 nuclear transport factor 2 family protein [Massilia sp. ST3]